MTSAVSPPAYSRVSALPRTVAAGSISWYGSTSSPQASTLRGSNPVSYTHLTLPTKA